MNKKIYEKVRKQLLEGNFTIINPLNDEEKDLVIENYYISDVIEIIGSRIRYSTKYRPGFKEEILRIVKGKEENRLEGLKENNKYLRDYLATMKTMIEAAQSNI